MFAAAGNCEIKTRDVQYPARYDEVFSIGYSTKFSGIQTIKNNNKFKGLILPKQNFETTYINSQFVEMSGSSINAAIVAGVGILLYQSLRRKGIDVKNPQILYNEIGKFAIKK
jgi:subtilisin family serine protease